MSSHNLKERLNSQAKGRAWNAAAQWLHSFIDRYLPSLHRVPGTVLPAEGTGAWGSYHAFAFMELASEEADSWTASHLAPADVVTELLHFSSIIHHSTRDSGPSESLMSIGWSEAHPQGWHVVICILNRSTWNGGSLVPQRLSGPFLSTGWAKREVHHI